MAKRASTEHGRSGERPTEPDQLVLWWLNEIEAAKKREKDYRKDGQDILDLYEAKGEKEHRVPFNILFSNTETLMPALYSATPRPVVQRRFKDDDPVGKAAATAGVRCLEFLVDTNVEGYESFDDSMTDAVLDACLPGRAMVCVKYDATVGELPPASGPLTGHAATPEAPTDATPYTSAELVCVETRIWNRVYFGYAKKWSKTPWIAYEESIDKREAIRLFGRPMADQLRYTDDNQDREKEESRPDEDHTGERKTTCIYQIWDKDGGKMVRYVSPHYKQEFLKVEEDPLGLTGFFNCPKPLQFVRKTHSTLPTPLYHLYERQAKELNRLTVRILNVVEAIKARGAYDGELGEDLGKLMQADDNTLIPTDKGSSLAAEKGFQNAIWFLPIEQLVNVLRELYAAREQCKQVIYEITGIADILRGASKANETLGAQKIKEAWVTLRLKRLQKDVQRYARDLLRMMLEIAATKFSEDTWAKMTGLPFTTSMQQQQLQAIMAAAQQAGTPPDPQTVAQLKQPAWPEVLNVLKNDLQRAYRIDIETNSTLEPEAAEDQKQITELMTAIGQYLNGVAPLVLNGALPFQAAQAMLLAITRRFRFGAEIEDYIKAMQPPKPPDDGKGEAAKQHLQQQQQMAEQQVQVKAKEAEMALQLKTMQAEKGVLEKQIDLELREVHLKAAEDKFKLEQQMAQKTLAVSAQGEHQKLDFENKKAQLQNTKFKTENVVNQKADQTLGKGITAMQDLVKQLVQAVAKQSTDNQRMVETLVATITKPRIKKAIRDQQGRIEAVEEQLA